MRSELASRFPLVQVPNRPGDPDARFFAQATVTADARSALRGERPGDTVRSRCEASAQSLRRAGHGGKGLPFSR
jgi:hypothetical protein